MEGPHGLESRVSSDTTIGRKFQVAGDDHQPEAGEKSCGTWESGGGNWAIRFEVNI